MLTKWTIEFSPLSRHSAFQVSHSFHWPWSLPRKKPQPNFMVYYFCFFTLVSIPSRLSGKTRFTLNTVGPMSIPIKWCWASTRLPLSLLRRAWSFPETFPWCGSSCWWIQLFSSITSLLPLRRHWDSCSFSTPFANLDPSCLLWLWSFVKCCPFAYRQSPFIIRLRPRHCLVWPWYLES